MPTAPRCWPTAAPRWSRSRRPRAIPCGGGRPRVPPIHRADGALFNFLTASKRSVVVDPDGARGLEPLHALLASADVVVWSRGSRVAEDADAGAPELLRAPPAPDRDVHHAVRTRWPLARQGRHGVHAAGVVGRDHRACAWQARACTGVRRGPDRRVAVRRSSPGIGTLAAAGARGPDGELVDVSMLEASAMCLTYYPVTFNDQLGRPMREAPLRRDTGCRRRQ